MATSRAVHYVQYVSSVASTKSDYYSTQHCLLLVCRVHRHCLLCRTKLILKFNPCSFRLKRFRAVPETLQGGTWDTVQCGTWDTVQGGTWDIVQGGTWDTVQGGTWDTVQGGTWDTVQGWIPSTMFPYYKVTVSPVWTCTYFPAKYTGPLQSTARILHPSTACKLPPKHPS